MSNLTDAQNEAINNALGDSNFLKVGASGSIALQAPVTATPFQVSPTRACDVYINVTTAAALAIAIGKTSSANDVTIAASESEALGVTTVHLPAGWYIDLTGTMADVTVNAVLS